MFLSASENLFSNVTSIDSIMNASIGTSHIERLIEPKVKMLIGNYYFLCKDYAVIA